jgi:3,4-dihydroxy 2-butanone 4-phosphate synthase/GTP cyclohydrolase II
MTDDAVSRALAALADGKMVVLVDDDEPDSEGDLLMAAQFATPATIAFFVRHTSGVICAPLPADRCDQLDLPLMVERNSGSMRTAFTDSVDAAIGVTNGISAADRARTLRTLADPSTVSDDFARPGHIFPLRSRDGGVLKRAGHTEGSVDLCRLANVAPVAVLSSIVNHDGTMARRADLDVFCAEHDLPLVTIADIVRHRRRTEKLVMRVGEAALPTTFGEFRCVAFQSLLDGVEHVAFVMGDPSNAPGGTLVRVHSECLTGDIFGSLRCDCGPQLHAAMRTIAEAGCGVVVYLRGHEGRGIGLGHKIRAYSLQDTGLDTVDANERLGLPVDSREYGVGAQILADVGVSRMRLITNNPAKYGGLEGFGLEIVERVPLPTTPTAQNLVYLQTKRDRMGHLLDLPDNTPGNPS